MTVSTNANLRRCWLVIGAAVWVLSGCGGDAARFKPPATTAREALDAALSAWKNGENLEAFATKSKQVRAVDTHWQTGWRLANFEVTKEEPSERDLRFTVRLTEDDPKAKSSGTGKEITYVVFGQEPIWVYRQEDYTRLLNMEDNPQPPRKGTRPGGRSR